MRTQRKDEEEKQAWYFHPAVLGLGVIVTIFSLFNFASKFEEKIDPIGTYRAEVTIALKGNKLTVKDILRLPDTSDGATGYTRLIPEIALEKRGMGGKFFIEGLTATLDKKQLHENWNIKSYRNFGQKGDPKNFYYGKQFQLEYSLIGAVKKENAARYATLQLLSKDLKIDAKRIELLVYFPQQVTNPKEAAELYIDGLETNNRQATGRLHGQTKNVVEISLEGLNIKQKNVFLKLTWLDFSETPES